MGYIIYRISGPSGKAYVGLTSTKLEKRWSSHVSRAFKENKNHPFYCAIRKYGPEAFTLEILKTVETAEEAAQSEKTFIELFRLIGYPALYNISDGGETDGAYGSRIFWDRIKADPEYRTQYIANLSAAKKNGGADHLLEASTRWRKENPKLAYQICRRNIRLAKRAIEGKPRRVNPCSEDQKAKQSAIQKDRWKNAPLSKKLRHSIRSRESAKAQWDKRSQEDREAVSLAISNSLKAHYAGNDAARKKVSEQLQEARSRVDRKKQGAAASKGLKAYWENLKKDPEAYAAYIERRKASLFQTLEDKKNDNKNL